MPDTVASRGLNIPSEVADADFLSRYDHQTLFYDAVRHGKTIRLFAPHLGNFEALLKRAQITVGGQNATVRVVRTRPRCVELKLASVPKDGPLSISADGWTWEGTPSDMERQAFRGKNASVLFNRNNAIPWIVNQLRFHQTHHGLNASVIVDNGSDAYTMDDLAEAIAGVGLDAVHVLQVPAPWGSAGPAGHSNKSLFLQQACLNLVRYRFLRHARAVLICDIDEIVMPGPNGESVFDAAARRWHGWLPIQGQHYFPPAPLDRLPLHSDHTHCALTPEKPSTKYCVAMGRPIGAFGWTVHKPDFASFDKVMRADQFRFLHCLALHNGWKAPDRAQNVPELQKDQEVAALFEQVAPK